MAKALCNALPASLRSDAQSKVGKKRIIGHFGNLIYRLTLTIKKKDAMTVFRYIFREKLDKGTQAFLSRDLEKLYDPKSQELYLRISKGRLVCDEMTLASGHESPVRVIIKLQQYGGSLRERTDRAWKFLLKEMSSGEEYH